jgi:molybdopterin adenylyltransferase
MQVPQVAILTISDRSSRREREDASGPALVERTTYLGWKVILTDIVPDDLETIQAKLTHWCDLSGVDVILTTGGTGFSPRDVTPEATQAVITRAAPGIGEAMRIESMKVTPHAMLSRAVAGIRNHTLIINLPGSPKAALENFAVVVPVIPHAIELLRESPTAEKGHQIK